MSEWKKVKLVDISQKISYGYTASATDDPVGPKFLRITDIRHGYIDWEQVPYCEISALEKEKYKLNIGDICVARTGASTGVSTVIKHEVDAVFASYLIRFQVDRQVADPFFVGYVLQSQLFENHVNGILGGSAQPNANAKQFGSFIFPLPPLPVQRRIAQILGRLDDKIEVNRRINRTLEAMAQALYKHWFVDFGPFQDGEFVESELGLIPKGWEVRALSEICKLTMGLSPKSEFYNEEGDGLPFHQGVTDFGERFPKHRRFCVVSPRVAQPSDILISVRAPVGRINVADTKIVIGRGLAALNHKQGYNSFLLYQLKHIFAEEDSMGSGTIFQAISKKDLQKLQLIVPPQKIVEQFNTITNRYDQQIASLTFESRKLAATRDYLLPRLLSGEVEVAVAD